MPDHYHTAIRSLAEDQPVSVKKENPMSRIVKVGEPVYVLTSRSYGSPHRIRGEVTKVTASGQITVKTSNGGEIRFTQRGQEIGDSYNKAFLAWNVEQLDAVIAEERILRALSPVFSKVVEAAAFRFEHHTRETAQGKIDSLRKLLDEAQAVLKGDAK